MKKYYKTKTINITKLKSYLDKLKTKKDEQSKGHGTSRNS
jgi:hypothetical protein